MGKLLEIEANSTPTTELRIGIELGLQPHLASRHKDLIEKLPIDYTIGSIHTVNHKDPYYDYYFEGRNAKDSYKEYFECVLENLEAFSDIDSLGHLDYVVRYGKRHFGDNEGACPLSDHKEIIEGIYKFIINHEIALEVNTGAYRTGLTEPNPSFEFLKFYKECGGKLITIGADAHKPEHVGLHFEKIAHELTSIGFNEYAIYKQHKAEMMTL
ncbi:MAG: histidinol-phosphatase HisJ family protein [Lachnospiraceae bacterium]|nr:histidinol-phosphatase HisJ family protein [Lachnospiraceae bacterium]